jgi:hypothetical protein
MNIKIAGSDNFELYYADLTIIKELLDTIY